MIGSRRLSKSLMRRDGTKRTHKNLEKEPEETLKNKRENDNEIDDQSSPRGVLEVTGSCSDFDNNSNISRSMSLSEKSEATANGGCDGDGENDSISPPTEMAQTVPWRNLIDNLKWKSFRRFSTGPLVAGYELSRRSFMKKLGRNNSSEANMNEFYVPKPSWRNFTFHELTTATNGFSAGKFSRSELESNLVQTPNFIFTK